MTRKRMTPADRRTEVLMAALRASARIGYNRVTRDAIATEAACSPGLVSLCLGTVPQMRRVIMREAVRSRCLPIIAQGLAVRDPHAMRAPEELRAAAAGCLV